MWKFGLWMLRNKSVTWQRQHTSHSPHQHETQCWDSNTEYDCLCRSSVVSRNQKDTKPAIRFPCKQRQTPVTLRKQQQRPYTNAWQTLSVLWSDLDNPPFQKARTSHHTLLDWSRVRGRKCLSSTPRLTNGGKLRAGLSCGLNLASEVLTMSSYRKFLTPISWEVRGSPIVCIW